MSSFTNDNPETPSQSNPTAASLSVAPISFGEFGDTDAQFKTEGQGNDITTRFLVKNRYEADRHIYMMGITSPSGFAGNQAAFVQLANKTLLWISDWTLARFNKFPRIPNPTPTDPNWILLDEHFEPDAITIGPDGVTPLYSISGIYIYGCRRPAAQTINNLVFPRPAWLNDVFPRFITTQNLEQGIINLFGTGVPFVVQG